MRARRVLGWAGLLALAATLATAGYWLLFTFFMGYDDEGYVLLSLRNYARHGALYDRVFSQYGPFFFATYDTLHRLFGFAWTNTNGRYLTLLLWLGTACFCALLVWRRSRSSGATALALGGVFTYLWVMVHEPTHPGGLIALLVAFVAWMGTVTDPAERPGAAIGLGAVAAALALTKINVGVFLFASSGTWLVVSARDGRVRRIGRWGLAAALVLMPWALMHSMLGAAWVREYAAVFVLGALGVLAVLQMDPRPVAGRRVTGAFLCGAAAIVALTFAIVLERGTTWSGLLDGVVLNPLRQPIVYHFAFHWRPGTLAIAVLGLAIAAAAWRRPDSRTVAGIVIAVRLLAMAVLVYSAFVSAVFPTLIGVTISLAALGMSYGVALAAVCALPLRRDAGGLADARVRQWLALILVLQFLHAYPVAGSQLNWGTFLWVPLLILAVRDAWLTLPARIRHRSVAVTATLGAFALSGVMAGKLLQVGLASSHQGEPLGLSGGEKIIVPDDTVFALRILAQNARAHADMLFSLSGLYSFNLWTGLPTPTLANATQWFESLTPIQQRSIVRRLRADPRPALIVQQKLLRYLVQMGFEVRGKLVNYLAHEFHPAFSVDGYAFWVRRERMIAPLSTGSITALSGGPYAHRMELVLASPMQPVARIELWAIGEGARQRVLVLSGTDSSLDVTPLDDSGRDTGPTTPSSWPATLPDGVVRIGVDFHHPIPRAAKLVAFVLTSDGHRVAAARILP